jgi:hypothetical protein
MNDLVENVLNEDYVSASEIFESRLNQIMEQKLYEKKRMMQAEAFGGMTKDEIEARRKAGYMKASEFFALKNAISNEIKKLKKGTKRLTAKKKVVKEAAPPVKITPAMRSKQLGTHELTKAAREYAAAKGETPEDEAPKKARKAAPSGKAKSSTVDVAGKMAQAGGRAPEVKLEPADIKNPKTDSKTDQRRAELADAGSKAKTLKAVPRANRGKEHGGTKTDMTAFSADEKRAKVLKARGSHAASRWLKATKTKRNVAGFKNVIGGMAKGLTTSLGNMSSNPLSEENN